MPTRGRVYVYKWVWLSVVSHNNKVHVLVYLRNGWIMIDDFVRNDSEDGYTWF